MPTAFVLINAEMGLELDVLKDLRKVEGVDEAFAVYGVYDVIVTVRAKTMDKLKEIITRRIRRIEKVRSTLTLIVSEQPPTPHTFERQKEARAVTRARTKLEREGCVREYTMIPDFAKLGYEIMALAFVNTELGFAKEEIEKAREYIREKINETPLDLIMVER